MQKYHYVYRITEKKINKHYIGVRSSKVPPYEDLGIKYFSSSSDKEFIKKQKDTPENFIYQVIEIFDSREKANLYEIFLHDKYNVHLNENFYNKAKQTSVGFDTSGLSFLRSEETKEKIRLANKGKIVSEETKEKIRLARANQIISRDTIESMRQSNIGTKRSEEFKKKMSELRSGENNPMFGKTHTEETLIKLSESAKGENNGMFGKKHSEETKAKISEKCKGRTVTEETKAKMRESKQKMSEETKAKMSQAHKGKKLSPESIEKTRQANLGKKQEIIKCPHCGKEGGKINMLRYHFDNCKTKIGEE